MALNNIWDEGLGAWREERWPGEGQGMPPRRPPMGPLSPEEDPSVSPEEQSAYDVAHGRNQAAIQRIAEALRRSRAALRSPPRPDPNAVPDRRFAQNQGMGDGYGLGSGRGFVGDRWSDRAGLMSRQQAPAHPGFDSWEAGDGKSRWVQDRSTGRSVLSPGGTGVADDPSVVNNRDYHIRAKEIENEYRRQVAGLGQLVRQGRISEGQASANRLRAQSEATAKFSQLDVAMKRRNPAWVTPKGWDPQQEQVTFQANKPVLDPDGPLEAPPGRGVPQDEVAPPALPPVKDQQRVVNSPVDNGNQNPLQGLLGLQAMQHFAKTEPDGPFAQFRGIHPGVVSELQAAGMENVDRHLMPRPWGVHMFPLENAVEGFGGQIQGAMNRMWDVNRANQGASVALKTAAMQSEGDRLRGEAAKMAAQAQLNQASNDLEKAKLNNPLMAALVAGLAGGQGGMGGGGSGFLSRRVPSGVNVNLPFSQPFTYNPMAANWSH